MARRILLVLGGVFAVLGVGQLIAAVATGISTLSFRSDAQQATGTIVSIDSHQSCSTHRRDGRRHRECHTVHQPTVEFRAADGTKISFVSSRSSSSYHVGQTLEVLYPADDPQSARLGGFGLWLVPIVLGAIGLPFAIVGAVLVGIYLKGRRSRIWLQQSGRRVQGRILDVERNRQLRINNVHPWRIRVGWQDPLNGKTYTFMSQNLMQDPVPALGGAQTVDVQIDPDDPQKKHWVDLTPFGLGSD